MNAQGFNPKIAFDNTGAPWVMWRNNTNYVAMFARYVGSGGTGCAAGGSTAWTCVTVDSYGGANNGIDVSFKFSPSGVAWFVWKDDSAGSVGMKVGHYVGSGGTGCISAVWQCEMLSSNQRGRSSLAFDQSGQPIISWHDGTDLIVSNHVGSGGNCYSTAWNCTIVDSLNSVGDYPSIAIDPSGIPWVSYHKTTGTDLKVAKYVGSGGSGCASSAWTCTTVDSTGSVGLYTSIAFDPSGQAWVSYQDQTNGDLKVARSTPGSGCATGAWSCTTVDSTNVTGVGTSLAFDAGGAANIAYFDDTDDDLKLAALRRSGEITIGTSASHDTGDALTASASDMTTTSDTANASDADCTVGGAAWNNGKFSESETVQISLPDGTSTQQCTELGFVINTSGARGGTTYRLMIAVKNGYDADKARWRSPATITSYATFTVSTSGDGQSTVAAAVDASLTFTVSAHAGSCNGVAQSPTSSVSGSSVGLGRINSVNGVGAQDLSVSTNGAGFTVNIKSTGSLGVIDDVAGSNASPSAFASLGTEAFGYTTSDSTLGTGTADRFTNGGAKWAALTTSNAEASFGTGPVTSDSSCVAYQAQVGPTTPAGSYTTTVIYTAVATY